jgi:hypothetical protein
MAAKGFHCWPSTGTGAISFSADPDHPASLVCVRLHLSAAGGAAENFTVTLNSARGAAYDCVLFSQDMTTVTDILWIPERPIPVINNDVLDFAWTNSNGRTFGLEAITQREDY